jgi:hypothetical protein
MPGRGRSSFTKRQKERSRQDKQREKAERRSQRKSEKQDRGPETDIGHNDVLSDESELLPLSAFDPEDPARSDQNDD